MVGGDRRLPMLHCALSYLFQQRKEGGGRGLCEKLYEFTQSPARETSFIREDPPCTQFGTVLYSVFCTVLTVVQYLACSRRGGGEGNHCCCRDQRKFRFWNNVLFCHSQGFKSTLPYLSTFPSDALKLRTPKIPSEHKTRH